MDMSTIQALHTSEWYAVWTRSRHEHVVHRELAQRDIDAFLPTITRWSRWKDRRKKIEWPLFPGYCFARFDPAHSLRVLTCTGVLNIVSFNDRPTPVPESEINSLRLLVTNDLQCDPCPLVHEGTPVEVIGGPLRGVRGVLLQKNSDRATLVISVELLNRAVRVEVDAADVRPLQSP